MPNVFDPAYERENVGQSAIGTDTWRIRNTRKKGQRPFGATMANTNPARPWAGRTDKAKVSQRKNVVKSESANNYGILIINGKKVRIR